eukprot:764934-Hanusia_phi.AAC.1
MSGFDEGRVTWSDQGLADDTRSFGVSEFQDFIRQFQVGDEFPYRDQLKKNTNMHEYRLEVNLDDLMTFNPKLNDALREKPAELMPIFERAARDVYASMLVGRREDGETPPDVQVILTSTCNPVGMRDLAAKDYSKLVHIQGIVISASKPRVKATMITLQCKSCKKLVSVLVKPGLHGCSFPRACEGTPGADLQQKCPLDPFQVLSDRSKYVDLQTLKIQELPEQVPTGEMPRHMTVTLDRHLVGRVVPGAVISAAGIFTILNQKPRQASASSVRLPYLRALGIMEVSGVGGRMTESDFTQEEESKFRSMAASPDFVEKLRGSIAPSIFGHTDIKKALCCQLFCGSRKLLPDGGRLRGDINVLMLGDPSTAKSQLLKFIEKVAPISVYTSGKGSSAAGLTASVVKDANSGEFYLEGGAMVLADGGIVCIDEFDKMRPEDRVAIHEVTICCLATGPAMEQQTISIAKAGITTMLNTRTAVLAAANPTFGRYDDMRSAVDNIDFQSTILSRFDLIFIIRDARNEERDQRIARHVMSLHSGSSVQQVEGEIDLNTMRRYICYARTKCSPRLSESAAKRLQDEYIRIRQRYAQESAEGAPAIPITVRQLEAIIRISESLAKMTLSPLATERHVEEAVQLFKESTEDAASKGLMMEGMTSPAVMADVLKSEKAIKERVGIGMSVPERSLVGELKERGLSEGAVRKAISVMLQRQELELRSQGKYICRRR